ncbi:MAG: 5'/3'-nucleotidase SurE [Bacteroidales bacterium]
MKERIILVTNDDGINAKGFRTLLEIIKDYGRVIAISTDVSKSGMSHSLTLRTPLRMKVHNDSEKFTLLYLNGTPVDCVKFVLNKYLNTNPDLLLSGINHGSNSSISSIYSGTVAAAREGAINGIPSIAFSLLDFAENADFSFMEPYIRTIVETVIRNGLDSGVCLNVNAPVPTLEPIKGIQVCRQAKGVWIEEFEKRTDPNGSHYYWLTGHFENYEPDAEDTDEWSLKNNYISVVPLHFETTATFSIPKLKQVFIQ